LAAYEQSQGELAQLLRSLRRTLTDAVSQRDAITGLALRDGLEPAFDLRCKDARRAGQTLWLAMIDVDRFKSICDIHGAAVGDAALHHVARALSACLRDSDVLIRCPGEEFLGLFLVSGPVGVNILAQRLLDCLRGSPLRTHYGLVLPLTATLGWARVRSDESLTDAQERAKQALLLGRAKGRNRFEMAPD